MQELDSIISIGKKTGKRRLPCISMIRRKNLVFCKKTELKCAVLMELSKITSSINTNYIFLEDIERCPGAKIKKEFRKKEIQSTPPNYIQKAIDKYKHIYRRIK